MTSNTTGLIDFFFPSLQNKTKKRHNAKAHTLCIQLYQQDEARGPRHVTSTSCWCRLRVRVPRPDYPRRTPPPPAAVTDREPPVAVGLSFYALPEPCPPLLPVRYPRAAQPRMYGPHHIHPPMHQGTYHRASVQHDDIVW